MKPKNIIYAFILLVLPLFMFAQKGIINNGTNIIVKENYAIVLEDDMELINQNDGTIDLDGMIQVEADVTNNSSSNKMFINPDNIGTLVLNGAVEQNLGGSNTIALDNLEVNSAGINLTSNIEQNGMLIFNSGRIYLNNYAFLFSPTSSISGTYSANNMFVVNGIGEVRKTFNSAGTFTFPIGEETEITEYSPAVINVSSISTNIGSYLGLSVTDQKFFRNTSDTEYLTRFWQISGAEINSINYAATFYYTDADIVGNEGAIYATAFTATHRIPYNLVTGSNNSFAVSNQTEFAVFTGADGSSGINNLLDDQFLIYPNPASININIEIPELMVNDIKVDLISQQGIILRNNIVHKLDFASNRQAKINVEEIRSGMYYLKFTTKEGVFLKKIIIE